MSDTIDLLEVIGRDASLRRPQPFTLTSLLEDADASDALKAAAAARDSSLLSSEFGETIMCGTQITQGPSHEEEDEDDDSKEGDEPGEVLDPTKTKSTSKP